MGFQRRKSHFCKNNLVRFFSSFRHFLGFLSFVIVVHLERQRTLKNRKSFCAQCRYECQMSRKYRRWPNAPIAHFLVFISYKYCATNWPMCVWPASKRKTENIYLTKMREREREKHKRRKAKPQTKIKIENNENVYSAAVWFTNLFVFLLIYLYYCYC